MFCFFTAAFSSKQQHEFKLLGHFLNMAQMVSDAVCDLFHLCCALVSLAKVRYLFAQFAAPQQFIGSCYLTDTDFNLGGKRAMV